MVRQITKIDYAHLAEHATSDGPGCAVAATGMNS